MGFKDLREYIEQVDKIGQLRRVCGANLDPEIGAITQLGASSPACPMFLFDNVEGCLPGYRIVTNVLHTEGRFAMALGEDPVAKGIGLVRKWKEVLSRGSGGPKPVEVSDGPVMENTMTGKDVDLFRFPVVKWHELDGGPYFTGGMVVERDPDEGWVNLGIYRLQVQDKATLSLHIEPGKHGWLIAQKYWAKGKSCPVAVSLGHVPALFVAGSLMAPWGISEYQIAGYLNNSPIEVLPGRLTGLPVPATSEVVLEGEAPPTQVESRVEGPWGEAAGYYASEAVLKPVIRVQSIMHRDAPIIQGAPPMKPLKGMKHFPVNHRCAALWSDLEKCGIPEIKGVWEHVSGMVVICLRQRYAGHAKQASLIASGSRSSAGVHFIVTVDDDIDPCNLSDVVWAMAMHCDPERDIEIVRDGWSGAIDPLVTREQAARNDFTTGKTLVNACRPLYRREAFPHVNAVSPELKSRILEKWSSVIE